MIPFTGEGVGVWRVNGGEAEESMNPFAERDPSSIPSATADRPCLVREV